MNKSSIVTVRHANTSAMRGEGTIRWDGTVNAEVTDLRISELSSLAVGATCYDEALQALSRQMEACTRETKHVPEHPMPARSFADYSPEEQEAMRKNLKAMALQGELFYQANPGKSLLQARPYDALSALEYGDGRLFQVTAGQPHSVGTSSHGDSTRGWEDTWCRRDHNFEMASHDTDQGSTSVATSATPIPTWDAVRLFAVPTGHGLPGITELPAPSAQIELRAWSSCTYRTGFDYQEQRGGSASQWVGRGFSETSTWEN